MGQNMLPAPRHIADLRPTQPHRKLARRQIRREPGAQQTRLLDPLPRKQAPQMSHHHLDFGQFRHIISLPCPAGNCHHFKEAGGGKWRAMKWSQNQGFCQGNRILNSLDN
jgi:hypothetical protein